jgi:hypothetical protein
MSTKLRDDFVSMVREHFDKHPDTPVPIPPAGCQLRRINADGSITYVSEQVTSPDGGRMCNVWRDYYDQYGRKHTIPEPEGDV